MSFNLTICEFLQWNIISDVWSKFEIQSLNWFTSLSPIQCHMAPYQCLRKLWRPYRPEDPQRYLNCRSCKSAACHNIRNQYNSHKLLPNSHKLLPVQEDLQMLYLPVHPLYCQPGVEDLQISWRLPYIQINFVASNHGMMNDDTSPVPEPVNCPLRNKLPEIFS